VSKPKRHQPLEKMLNVLICAASSLARAGLERLLDQHGVRVVAEVSNAGDLPAKIAESDPEVIILRLDAPPREIRWQELMALGVPVVLLVESVDSIHLSAAVANGVQAILVGDVTGAELAAAVASAAATPTAAVTPTTARRKCRRMTFVPWTEFSVPAAHDPGRSARTIVAEA